MKTIHTFIPGQVYEALNSRANGGIRIYRVERQRGGGFGGNVIKLFSRYVVPLFNKYILPSAKENLVSFTNDMLQGASLKSALKKNSRSLAKDIVGKIAKPQSGGNFKRRSKVVLYFL